jgi:enoyl-CoA hydratase/carnithine racemase
VTLVRACAKLAVAMKSLDTGTDELLATLEDGVALLTLNRPESRNALSDTLSPALRRMFARLPEMPEARCVVLTGTGTAFCAGGDVKGMGSPRSQQSSQTDPPSRADQPSKPSKLNSPNPVDRPTTREGVVADLTERQRTLTGALHALPQPTIAALPGAAAGAGFSIALACDLRIAAERAFVTTGFANVGLAGDYGSTFFLPRLVGQAKARELFFTADRLDAATCLSLGIVNRVVPNEKLMEETMALARRLASGPTEAYRLMKANLDRSSLADLDTSLAFEAEATVASAGTEDHREAVRAFIEKRKPEFKGR